MRSRALTRCSAPDASPGLRCSAPGRAPIWDLCRAARESPGSPGSARGYATQGDFTLLRGPGRAVASSSLGAPCASRGQDPHAWLRSPGGMGHPPALLGLSRTSRLPGRRPRAPDGDAPVGRRCPLRRHPRNGGTAARRDRQGGREGRAPAAPPAEDLPGRGIDAQRRDGQSGPARTASRSRSSTIWPRSVELLAGAIAEGTVEQICHGFLHVDTARSRPGSVEPREFGNLDRDEARERISCLPGVGPRRPSELGREPLLRPPGATARAPSPPSPSLTFRRGSPPASDR